MDSGSNKCKMEFKRKDGKLILKTTGYCENNQQSTNREIVIADLNNLEES